MRVYHKESVISFSLSNAPYGELSNFNPKFPISVKTTGGVILLDSTETWYQADKFRDRPEIQEKVLKGAADHHNAPRGGKTVATSSEHTPLVSEDWVKGRSVQSMRFAIRLKLNQHWDVITKVLAASGDKPIVEYSKRDEFWGAKPQPDGTLRGQNVLGRLWMEVRMELQKNPDYCRYTVPCYGTKLLGHDVLNWVRPAKILNAHAVGTDVPGAIYVGRSKQNQPYNKWCNPIPVSDEFPRGKALEAYLDHLRSKPELIAEARAELAGRDLICWCAPRACHGGVLAHVAAGNPVPDTWGAEMQQPTKNTPEADVPQTAFDF